MFEKVNKAYEFLCSAVKIKDGPDPENIALILKTQCILFKRYSDVLHPYKYAGYPMLIKTIQMETRDEQLFSKKDQLLTNSCELACETIKCSSLNAEELRRENGLEYLNEAFSRCVNMLSQFGKNEADMPVQVSIFIDFNTASCKRVAFRLQVCIFVAQCFAAAAQFEQCRSRMLALPNMIKDLCRCLYFKNLPNLCSSAAEAVSAFAPDVPLQNALHQAGVLVHLLFYMFNYDFTLDEGGVERSKESNQQEVANHLARICVQACARLAGFCDASTADKQSEGIEESSMNSLLT